ncbi:beta strand repeat-containing protein [Luteolibacter soli]|uniref:Autotransporter-associated beta strand repeat-containing protein n=1 Tax=Luteolibacter soli TaxID=3135280 RepID=A0ABU9APS1_9BACT
MRSASTRLAIIHAGVVAFAPSFAAATNLYWDNNGATAGTTATPTGTWGTSNFWNTDAAGGAGTLSTVTTAADDVFFSAGTAATGAYTVTVSGARAAHSVTVEEGSLSFAGANTPSLTLGTGGILVDGTGKLGGVATLTSWLLAGNQTWTTNSTGTVPVFNPSASTTLAGVPNTGNIVLTLSGTNGTVDSVLYRGVISNGTGNTLALIKNGTGTWRFEGANTYTGGFTLNSGVMDFAIGSAGAANAVTSGPFGTGTLTINGGSLKSRGAGRTIFNPIVLGGDFSIIGNNPTTLAGSMDLGGVVRTISLVDPAATHIVSGVISNGALTKAGPNPLSLTAANTYAGATTVSTGTLIIGGTGAINSSSGISVSGSNAKLLQTGTVPLTPAITVTEGIVDGTGTVGEVNFANSPFAALANGNNGSGTFTTGNLNFAGAATITANISGTAVGIAAGALTTSGTDGAIVVNVNRTGAWNNGPNNLISFTSFPSADVGDFAVGVVNGPVLGARQSIGGLVLNGNNLALQINGNPIRWTGLQNGQWTINNVGGSLNWKLTSDNSPTDFIEGDDVVFDDAPGAAQSVQIDDGDVRPSTTTFNNSSAVNYTISSNGGFGIAGGPLTKNGTGTLTLASTNFYADGTVLNDGRLNLNSSLAIGSGPFTINGGVIGNTSGAPVALSSTNQQNLNVDLSFVGPSDLDLGSGALRVGGAGTNRSITVDSGTLTMGELKAPAHGVTKLGAGTLILSSLGPNAEASVVAGTLNVAAGTVQMARTGIAGGDLTTGGITGTGTITNGSLEERWLYVVSAVTGAFDGTLADGPAGALGFNKQGVGTFTLTGPHSYSGRTTVGGGTLVMHSTNSLSGDVDVASGILRAEANGALGVGLVTIRNLASGLQLQGGITLPNPFLTSNDGSGASGYAIASLSGNNTLTGDITMTDGASFTTVQSDSGALTLTGTVTNNIAGGRTLILEGASTDANKVTGVIQDGTGITSLNKRDAGSWTLEGTNTYTGGTTVTLGTLTLTKAYLSDTSAVTIANGATLQLAHALTDRVGSLTINGVVKGNGVYDATTDPGFISGTGKIRVGPEPGYASWTSGFPFTVGVNDAPEQDADGDGISNVLEYVLGGVPVGAGASDTSILPQQSLTATDLVLTFRRSDLSETDAIVKVQWSTTLGGWNDFATIGAVDALPAVDITEDSPTAALDTVVVRIPRSNAGGGKLFGRVVATKP